MGHLPPLWATCANFTTLTTKKIFCNFFPGTEHITAPLSIVCRVQLNTATISEACSDMLQDELKMMLWPCFCEVWAVLNLFINKREQIIALMCNIIIVPLCFLLYRTETVPSSVPWGIVMKMWESLDLHSLPPELQHISRNGLFPYSLWSVIKILTWYYQTHFFPNQQLYICYYHCQNISKKGRQRIVSIPHLCIFCSKMKLIIPVFWMQGKRLNAKSEVVWASFHKSHLHNAVPSGNCWAQGPFRNSILHLNRQCLRDDVLLVLNLQSCNSLGLTWAASRPEVGSLRRKPVGQSRWGSWG